MCYGDLILYDWFSFTSKIDSFSSMIDLLGIDPSVFRTVQGARGYTHREYFNGISVHHGGREEVWLEMSGQGCRAFESFGHGSWETLFGVVLSDKAYHVTRLDVAFDDRSGFLDLQRLFDDVDAGRFVSKFDAWEICKSNKGLTVYHGAPSSDLLFRIYDKARERGREDEGHWVRFEMQLRDNRATRFLGLMILQPIGEVFAGVLKNYLRYVTPTNDSNRWRWPVADYWAAFIGAAEKISLYEAPGTEYNFEKLERFAVDQAGAAAASYVAIAGEDAYIEKIREKLAQTRNPKYADLISRLKMV